MNKILIAHTDNSIEEQMLTDTEFANKLSGSVSQHDITGSLTMWTYSNDALAGFNDIANRIYDDHRGMNDSFFYGDAVFTGKSTISRVYSIDADAEYLVRSYLTKESKESNA